MYGIKCFLEVYECVNSIELVRIYSLDNPPKTQNMSLPFSIIDTQSSVYHFMILQHNRDVGQTGRNEYMEDMGK